MTVVYHPSFLTPTQVHGHPECPERVAAIMAKLEELELLDDTVEPEPAPMEKVLRVHDGAYIDFLRGFGEGYMDPDTYVRPDTLDAALIAAGGALEAAEIAYNERRAVFAPLRPPGHHASSGHGGGFCYINNAAVAAAEYVERGKKVVIIDYDVHHGNGTSDIFYDTDKVLYISTHQWGIYPGSGSFEETGEGKGEGYTVNIPLPAGSGDSTFASLFDRIIAPICSEFEPGIVLVSMGGDAHYMDLLGSLALSTPGYVELLRKTMKMADAVCEGRLATLLDGGYHIGALADVAAGIVGLFDGKDVETEFNETRDTGTFGKGSIERAISAHAGRWSLGRSA
ncbi:MAG: histone deacetylase [Euryarchaeota archaeon]|nr:histone deacetylase [Euryarchaeota archaeon]